MMKGIMRTGQQPEMKPIRTNVPIIPNQTKPAMLAGLE